MQDNPYVGPRPFELDDKDIFFGREQESQGLLSLVISQRVVLFFSPSGAGKSSLINTRLVPGLVNEGFYVYPVARIKGSERVTDKSIANIFTYNLLNSLSRSENLEVPGYLSIAGFFEDDALKRGYQETQKKKVLIIDQFEELFTSHLDRWQERKAFFDQLRQSLDADPLLWLILVMREDQIANLEPYTSLLPGRLQTRFYMSRMNVTGALEAIKRPAEKAGRAFAPGVAEELVDNLRQIRSSTSEERHLGEFVEPVQLQVVCRQLWTNLANRQAEVISAADVRELGDIDAALAQFYDGVVQDVARLAKIPELTLRTWFENELITEIGTRALAYEGAEQTSGIPNSAVRELANQYLIRAETRPGGTWYELVHDRFVVPIQRSNREWLLQQNPILQDAYAWDRSGRDESRLYQGGRLELALFTVDQQTSDPLVALFLKASSDAQEQLSLAQRAATARRDRILLVISGVLLVGVAVLALLFWQQRQIAMMNAQLAQTAQVESNQGRATIAANATIQADQITALQYSLEQQVVLLEEQKKALLDRDGNADGEQVGEGELAIEDQCPDVPAGPNPDPERPGCPEGLPTATATILGASTATPSSIAATPQLTRMVPSQSVTSTSEVEVIETQIAQINATQTAIAAPSASLRAIFPNIGVAIREQPSEGSELIEYAVGGSTLPVIGSVGNWVQVESANGRTGWVYGRLLTFDGDKSKLPPGLHSRLTSDRDRTDLPFVYGRTDSQGDILLLRDPNDLNSTIIALPTGTDVTVLQSAFGDREYGSGRWYLVDVVQANALWTGYLPIETVVERD